LWVYAGGAKDRIPLYDTEGGWLHLDTDELVAGARQSQAAGWPGIKIKLGRSPVEDARRLAAIRAAVGPDLDLMVDANQSLTAADAIRRCRLLEPSDPYWFEEPLPADDVSGHAMLTAATTVPVAVGESMYSVTQFAEYLHRNAAGIVQVDVARIGGITPWLKVAHLAEAHNVVVCPHFLMELHVSLCCAVPNSRYLEHIPQLRAITRRELEVAAGAALAPSTPGLGIDWDRDAIDDRRVQ
jgi:L-alanine-DL-glutamate epimerase-like enolase superfamily enzyme